MTIPDVAEVRSAGTELGLSEDILQGNNKGDARKHLRIAAHYLGCDTLEIPLKQTNDTLTPLFVKLAQKGHEARPAAFYKVLSLLRTALTAVFEQSNAGGRP